MDKVKVTAQLVKSDWATVDGLGDFSCYRFAGEKAIDVLVDVLDVLDQGQFKDAAELKTMIVDLIASAYVDDDPFGRQA